MLNSFRHNNCIWCGRPFAIKGFQTRPGEVQRSDEHIIPKSIFGQLETNDLCKQCNDRLGSDIDHHLLNDLNVFLAGKDAGFKPEQLLPVFRVSGTTPDGEPFEYVVKDGVWRLTPSFHTSGFQIGVVNGAANARDLKNAKRKMLCIVTSNKALGVSYAEAEEFVETLFSEFLAKQGEYEVRSKHIQQGLRSRPVPSEGVVKITTHPWQTQWAVAKIMYETGQILLPGPLRRSIPEAFHQLRAFVVERKERKGIFKYKKLSEKASPQHEVEITVQGSTLEFATRFFHREQWSVSFTVTPIKAPVRLGDYRLLVINDCRPGISAPVQIVENGHLVTFACL